jgi:hypothetical protein
VKRGSLDPLTLRGFLSIAVAAALAGAIGVGSYLAVVGNLNGKNIALTGLFCVLLGFMFAACWYLVQYGRELKSLDLSPDQLEPHERVLRRSGRPIIHYKTGKLWKTWQGVGGKLFLTSQRLVFLAHRGQPWHYQLYLPLTDIVTVEPSDAGPGVPGGVAVILDGGRREVFGWGAIGFLATDEWIDAIMAASKRAKRS